MRWLLQLCWLSMSAVLGASDYRVSGDQCIAPNLLPAVAKLARQLASTTPVDLHQLGTQLQQRLVSVQRLQLMQINAQTVAIKLQSVQPLYLLNITELDQLYVLVRPGPAHRTIIPARLINPVCLEQLPTAQIQIKAQHWRPAKRTLPVDILTPAEAKLQQQLPAELPAFLMSLTPWLQQNFLVEWQTRNCIKLHYRPTMVPITLLTRVGGPLTEQLAQASLQLVFGTPVGAPGTVQQPLSPPPCNSASARQLGGPSPALFFAPESGVTTSPTWPPAGAPLPAGSTSKLRVQKLAPVRHLTLDLRFHNQVIIANTKGATDE